MTLLGNSNRLLPHLWEIITGSYYISLGNRNKFQSLLWPGEYKQVLATSLGQPRPEKIWFWVFISILTLVQSVQHTYARMHASKQAHTQAYACTRSMHERTHASARTHTHSLFCLSTWQPPQPLSLPLCTGAEHRNFSCSSWPISWLLLHASNNRAEVKCQEEFVQQINVNIAKWVSKR